MITFVVPGAARGKQRARTVRNGSHTYTPKETLLAENQIAWYCREAMKAHGATKLEGPVMLEFRALYNCPSSWSKKKKAEAYWKTTKPDLDNIEKLLKDALNGVAWVDDAQIAKVAKLKRYIEDGEEARIVVTIKALL